MKRFLVLILLFTDPCMLGCTIATNPPKPVIVEPVDTLDCDDACSHLRDLSCEEGKNLPDGTTCESFCENTQQNGHALAPSCVVNIDSCDDMDNIDMFCPVNPSSN